MLDDFLALPLFNIFLVFVRLGAALMLMPGFSGPVVSPRVRLIIALTLSYLILPSVTPTLAPMPASVPELVLLIMGEAMIGAFLGLVAQTLLSAVSVAGAVGAYISGMANAFIQDPVSDQQGALLTSFLSNVALLVLLATDMHHVMLRAIADSYHLFPPGQSLMLEDMAETMSHLVSAGFRLGMQLVAPLIVFSLVFYAGLGMVARLMPQLQVFFVALPLQVVFGMAILMIAMPGIMMLVLRHFEEGFLPFLLVR